MLLLDKAAQIKFKGIQRIKKDPSKLPYLRTGQQKPIARRYSLKLKVASNLLKFRTRGKADAYKVSNEDDLVNPEYISLIYKRIVIHI